MTHHRQIPKTKLKEYRHNQTLAENGQLWAFSSDLEPTFPHPAAQEVITLSAVLQPAEWQNKPKRNTLYFLDFGQSSPNFADLCTQETLFGHGFMSVKSLTPE